MQLIMIWSIYKFVVKFLYFDMSKMRCQKKPFRSVSFAPQPTTRRIIRIIILTYVNLCNRRSMRPHFKNNGRPVATNFVKKRVLSGFGFRALLVVDFLQILQHFLRDEIFT